jgi:hypothetical protein
LGNADIYLSCPWQDLYFSYPETDFRESKSNCERDVKMSREYRVRDGYAGIYIETKDLDGDWEEVTRYCGGPAGTATQTFETLAEAKKWIKKDAKNYHCNIIWEYSTKDCKKLP